MILDELHTLGLSKTEARIYLFLLESGISSPAQIAKGTGVLRTNCYHVLQNLEAQGLITTQATGLRKAYVARDPESLYQSIEKRKDVITRLLPDLRGLYTVQKHKPKIQFYEGLDQIEEVYKRSLEAKEVYGIGSSNLMNRVMPDFYKMYIREIKQRKIVFHDILTFDSHEFAGPLMQEQLKGLYDVAYLSKKHGDVPTDLLIWGDHIARITFEDPVFATVITSPLLARTMRTLFAVMKEGL